MTPKRALERLARCRHRYAYQGHRSWCPQCGAFRFGRLWVRPSYVAIAALAERQPEGARLVARGPSVAKALPRPNRRRADLQ